MEYSKTSEVLQAEHNADPNDRASMEAEVSTQEALREHSRRAAGEIPPPTKDGMCVDGCGDPVEPARLAIGLGRCLCCAQDREALTLHRRRTRGF